MARTTETMNNVNDKPILIAHQTMLPARAYAAGAQSGARIHKLAFF